MKLYGVDYIDAQELGRRVGMKASWIKSNERLLLQNERRRIELEAESRECAVDGMRVFLGEAARFHGRTLWVSKIDADKLLLPVVSLGRGQKIVPALKTIVIDPGHGGIDFGKINERLKVNEKNLALDTSLRLKKMLEEQGYRVIMTRNDDRKIELEDRPALAGRNGADLFLSLHFNAVADHANKVTGVEVYRFTPQFQMPVTRTMRKAEDAESNPGDADAHWSAVAGILMHNALLANLKVADRGFKHDKLKVLRLAPCPAILIESGFLSNDVEAKKISVSTYRQQIAEAISEGVRAYAAALVMAHQ